MEKRIKIYVNDENGVRKEFSIPPIRGSFYLENAELCGQLLSTRGGANFNWSASNKARSFMTKGPYQPRIHVFIEKAFVTCLGWHAYCEIIPDEATESEFRLSWGGTLIDSPVAITAQGRITDLSRRKEREGIFASLKKIDCVPEYHQGHLAVYAVETPSAYNQDEEWDGSIFRHPQRPLVLYNHALFVEAALGLDNKRLFKVRDETTLTSPDHPLEPITFNTGNGDWYVMEHPIPSDRDVD